MVAPAFALKFYSDMILPEYLRGTSPAAILLFGTCIGLGSWFIKFSEYSVC